MPALNEVARAHTDLDADDVRWLHRLIGDWQIIGDTTAAPASLLTLRQLLSRLLLDGHQDPLLAAFDPARFARRGRARASIKATTGGDQ